MTGQKIYDMAAAHVGEKYLLGALVPKNDPNYSGPWDCAEFVTWIIYQLTGRLYGCTKNNGRPDTADAYTGFWARDADKLGNKITVGEAVRTPGAALLRVAGNGQIGHIVVTNGYGGTAEAQSTRTGVVLGRSSGRRWDYGVLIPWITYAPTQAMVPINPPTKIIYRYSHPLMRDPVETRIKSNRTKYLTGPIAMIQRKVGMSTQAIDGIYGPQTFNTVRNFQLKYGLVADGEVGPNTARALGII